jgi:hypothetical protein
LVTAAGRTIGSTRSGAKPTLFESPVAATAVGGGRLWNNETTARPGYAGYLVLENVIKPENAALQSGTAQTLGSDGTSEYGYLRLAAGSSSVAADTIAGRSTGSYAGFVAGAAETDSSNIPLRGKMTLQLNATNNSVGTELFDLNYAPGQSIRLGDGGAAGETDSAYIKPGAYGALVENNTVKAALIAGEAVKAGLGDTRSALIGTTPDSGSRKPYEHVQWGFFFGDVLPAGGKRAHVALASWAAGTPMSQASCVPNCSIRGTASYNGHAIGTVIAGSDVYNAVGRFEQSWNFDSRTGSMSLDFDRTNGEKYVVPTLSMDGADANRMTYGGISNVTSDTRAARIGGELVDIQARTGGGHVPTGTIGTFEIRSLNPATGAANGLYQANGTFAGDISTPH